MSQNKRKMGKNKRRGRRRQRMESDENTLARPQQISVFRSAGQVVSEQSIVDLHYYTTYNITNVGVSFASIRFRPNNVFDVDPALGSTATPGFAEMAALYGTYRVLGYEATVDVCNGEAFAVQVFAIPWSNLQTAPAANDTTTPSLPMNQLASVKVISAKGGMDRCVLKNNVDFAKVYSKQIMTDDSFAAKVTTGPGFVLYNVVGVIASGSSVLTAAGVSAFIHYRIRVMFYGRQVLTT